MNDNDTYDDDTDNDELFWGMVDWKIGTGLISSRHNWLESSLQWNLYKADPYKAETSERRTVWRGTDCFVLRSNYLRKNLYKADTFLCTNGVRFIEIPLYLQSW